MQILPLSISTKRLLYLSFVRPIWQYASGLYGSASDSQLKRIQVQQNRVLRLITDAPWYVRNSIIHKDLDVPEVKEVVHQTYRQLYASIKNHANPVFSDFVQRLPVPRANRRLKRRHHADQRPEEQQ